MLHAKKILIVDAAESTRHFMRYILANAGYRVFTAISNGEALELLEESHFDAVFVDIRPPDLEGLELIQSIRTLEDYQSTPVIVVTMSRTDSLMQKGSEVGVTEWVAKPVSPAGLLDLLKKLKITNGPPSSIFG